MIGATKMWLLAPSKNLGPGGGEHPGTLLTSPRSTAKWGGVGLDSDTSLDLGVILKC